MGERTKLTRPEIPANVDPLNVMPTVAGWVTRPQASTSNLNRNARGRKSSVKPKKGGKKRRRVDSDSESEDEEDGGVEGWDQGTDAGGLVINIGADGVGKQIMRRECSNSL